MTQFRRQLMEIGLERIGNNSRYSGLPRDVVDERLNGLLSFINIIMYLSSYSVEMYMNINSKHGAPKIKDPPKYDE